MSSHLLSSLLSLVSPLLLTSLVVGILVHFRRDLKGGAVFFAVSLLALLATFVLAHLNRWMFLWKGHLMFPSGHMTFYLSLATSMAILYRRSLVFTIPLGVLYGYGIVALKFHTWLDLAGAMVLAPVVTWSCHRLLRARAD